MEPPPKRTDCWIWEAIEKLAEERRRTTRGSRAGYVRVTRAYVAKDYVSSKARNARCAEDAPITEVLLWFVPALEPEYNHLQSESVLRNRAPILGSMNFLEWLRTTGDESRTASIAFPRHLLLSALKITIAIFYQNHMSP